MSKVKRLRLVDKNGYPACPLDDCIPGERWVSESDYDAAQSELSALREELARKDVAFEDLVESNCDMAQFLASAEQRNAELEVFERFAGYLLDHCEGETIYEESLQYWLSESIRLYKPTESGASE